MEKLNFMFPNAVGVIYMTKWQSKKTRNTKKKFELLLKDFAVYLENKSEEKTEFSLKILFHGEQRNTIIFAHKLVKLLKHPLKVSDQLLPLIKKWKNDIDFNPSFFCGFIRGLSESFQKETQHILDKIADSTELVDFILPAYLHLNLQDQDIKRLINVINKTELKSNELRTLAIGNKCQAVSPEMMEQLLQALIKKGGQALWNALNIYMLYVYGKTPEKKKKLLPVLFELLMQDKLLSDKKRYNSMDDYYYEKAVNNLLNSDYGPDFSKKFVSHIINSKIFLLDFAIDSETIKKCFIKIIEKYPDTILTEIIDSKGHSNIDFLFKINTSFRGSVNEPNILSSLNEEQIKEWCARAPDKIPFFLAKNMGLFYTTNGNWSWSPFIEFLLDEYGDKEALTNAISMNLGQFSWTGNLSDYFEQLKKPMEELKTHKHTNVRKFAEDKITHLDKEIKTQKQKEKELEKFGIW